MTVTIQREASSHGVIAIIHDALHAADVRAIQRELYHVSTLPDLHYVLIDLQRCSLLDLSADDLEEFSRTDADAHAINPQFVIAIVVPANLRPELQLRYRIYQSFYANTVELFEDIVPARAWIQSQLAANKA